MSVKSVLEIIAAAYQNTPIEVHRMGQWCTWTGPIILLVQEMQSGTVFRVKRVPRTVYMLQTADGQLVSHNHQRRSYVEDVRRPEETIVEFREVLP